MEKKIKCFGCGVDVLKEFIITPDFFEAKHGYLCVDCHKIADMQKEMGVTPD